MLIVGTIVLTAALILALILSFCLWLSAPIAVLAVSMWVTSVLYYLETAYRTKNKLDKLMLEGERIRVILGGNTEADYDRGEDHTQQWNVSVDRVMKGTEYEQSWKSSIGLTIPEDLSGLVGLPLRFAAQRNYMAQRLSRLKEIRDGL